MQNHTKILWTKAVNPYALHSCRYLPWATIFLKECVCVEIHLSFKTCYSSFYLVFNEDSQLEKKKKKRRGGSVEATNIGWLDSNVDSRVEKRLKIKDHIRQISQEF